MEYLYAFNCCGLCFGIFLHLCLATRPNQRIHYSITQVYQKKYIFCNVYAVS
eukprot:UN16451